MGIFTNCWTFELEFWSFYHTRSMLDKDSEALKKEEARAAGEHVQVLFDVSAVASSPTKAYVRK